MAEGSVAQRAGALREKELQAAAGLGFRLAQLSAGEEQAVGSLWRHLVASGIEDPFVAGKVNAGGLAELGKPARSPAEQALVQRGVAEARGHRVPWAPPGNWPGLDPAGRPLKKLFKDSTPSEPWQEEEMRAFVEKSLAEGAISEVRRDQLVMCLPIFVIDQGHRKRVIWDAREANFHLDDCSVQYEGVQWVELLRCRYMSKLDLQSGYYQIPLCPEDRPWAGFSWTAEGAPTRFFWWNILPFGLASAPKAFTEVLKILAWRWRVKGVTRVVIYLDDIWFGGATFSEWLRNARLILKDIRSAGLRLSPKKAFLGPYDRMEFLGLLLDAIADTISVPGRTLEKLKSLASGLLALADSTPLSPGDVKALEKFLGTLSFCGACLKGCGVFRRLLDNVLRDWYRGDAVSLGAAKAELRFWADRVDTLNGRSLSALPVARLMLAVDTSDTASGCLAIREGRVTGWARFPLSESEKLESSTVRELLGLVRGLEWLISTSHLEGFQVLAAVDNASAVAAGARMAMGSATMIGVMTRLWDLLTESRVDLRMEWCPRWRAPIPLADWLSKVGATPSTLPEIWNIEDPREEAGPAGGPLPGKKLEAGASAMLRPDRAIEACVDLLGTVPGNMVDLFAEHWNRQPFCTGGFCSRMLEEGSLGNAFCLDWSGRTLWAFPPFSQTRRVLLKWLSSQPPCTLILIARDDPWDPLPSCIRVAAGSSGRSVVVPRSPNLLFGLLLDWHEGFSASQASSWPRPPPPPFGLRAWLFRK